MEIGISAQPSLSFSLGLRGILHPVEQHIPFHVCPLKLELGPYSDALGTRGGGAKCHQVLPRRESIFTKSMSVKMGCPRKRTWKICRHKSRQMRWGQSPSEPELGTSTRHAHLQELQCRQRPCVAVPDSDLGRHLRHRNGRKRVLHQILFLLIW